MVTMRTLSLRAFFMRVGLNSKKKTSVIPIYDRIVEWINKIVIGKVRSMRLHAGLPK